MSHKVHVFPLISNVSQNGRVVITWWAEVRDENNQLIYDRDGRLQRIRLTPTYPDPARRQQELEEQLEAIWQSHGGILQANTALGFDEVERQG